ncbi:hypothetical protein [Helicobacter apodemus]|nr:hypothetical protein [Helicobacter apodemus]
MLLRSYLTISLATSVALGYGLSNHCASQNQLVGELGKCIANAENPAGTCRLTTPTTLISQLFVPANVSRKGNAVVTLELYPTSNLNS